MYDMHLAMQVAAYETLYAFLTEIQVVALHMH